MKNYELEISKKDWAYIFTVAIVFGFLISWVFYLLNAQMRDSSTIVFSVLVSLSIVSLSFIFITISNSKVLPNVKKRYWQVISLILSFLAGCLGFMFVYLLFDNSSVIKNLISDYGLAIGIVIGFLTSLIGLILHKFTSMKYKNELANSEMIQVKLDALESELNPHFLFNALNSIAELIHNDKNKAEDSVLKLSVFLRNAITKKGLIDIRSELEMINTYLHIENMRFDNKIVLNVNCKDEYYDMLLPKFSIQLLIENAIKHGFIGRELIIDVNVFENKIEIINDGKLTKDVKFGIGLSNLEKRLKILKIGMLENTIDQNRMKFIINRSFT